MNAHAFPDALTARAFDARVAALTCKGFHETDGEADLHGETLYWTVFMETECYQRVDNEHHYLSNAGPLTATLAGAWAEDSDGNLYAGNRDEIIALIGEAAVTAWETKAEWELNS